MIGHPNEKKIKLNIHVSQFQVQYINVNVNGKTIRLSEVNIQENLHDFGIGETFQAGYNKH